MTPVLLVLVVAFMRLARGLDEPDSPASDAYSLSKTLLLIS